jgi:hypothetical protein
MMPVDTRETVGGYYFVRYGVDMHVKFERETLRIDYDLVLYVVSRQTVRSHEAEIIRQIKADADITKTKVWFVTDIDRSQLISGWGGDLFDGGKIYTADEVENGELYSHIFNYRSTIQSGSDHAQYLFERSHVSFVGFIKGDFTTMTKSVSKDFTGDTGFPDHEAVGAVWRRNNGLVFCTEDKKCPIEDLVKLSPNREYIKHIRSVYEWQVYGLEKFWKPKDKMSITDLVMYDISEREMTMQWINDYIKFIDQKGYLQNTEFSVPIKEENSNDWRMMTREDLRRIYNKLIWKSATTYNNKVTIPSGNVVVHTNKPITISVIDGVTNIYVCDD